MSSLQLYLGVANPASINLPEPWNTIVIGVLILIGGTLMVGLALHTDHRGDDK